MRQITSARRFCHAPDRPADLLRLDIILPKIREHTKDARRLHVPARITL